MVPTPPYERGGSGIGAKGGDGIGGRSKIEGARHSFDEGVGESLSWKRAIDNLSRTYSNIIRPLMLLVITNE